MRILHVVNIYFTLSYFGDQFDHFQKKGYKEFLVCSPSEYLPEYAKQHGIEYLEVPINRKISLVDDIKAIKAVYHYIKKNNIDIVVGHTPKGALVGIVASFLARVPKRLFFRHGLVYETSKGVVRWCIMAADRLTSFCATKIICVSPSVLQGSIKDRLAPVYKQGVLNKGTCNGVDTHFHFNPKNVDNTKVAELRVKYGIEEDDFVVGFTGRLVRDKGIIELVEAFIKLKKNHKMKLLLVGMFEERDAIPESLKQNIMNDPDIIFTGFVNGGMELYYSLIDAYVLASYREGFPTGVLEAQSMSIPVLTTRATGCRDSIVDGVTGFFVSHDSDDIAEKLLMLMKYGKSIGRNGRRWVLENFDSHVIWDEIEKLYN